MKTFLALLMPVTMLLLSLQTRSLAQESDFWWPYRVGTGSLAMPNPTGTNTLNCVLPENSGGYVAVWDAGDSAIVERRNSLGNQLWTWSPPTPLPVQSELTRVVYGGPNRVLWCSTMRWFFLDNTNGLPVSNGLWSLPYLDPSRIIIQDDNLHVLYGNNASVYNTNMEFQATLTDLAMPSGYWQSYAGAWLVDHSTRRDYFIRVAPLNAGLQVGDPFHIALPSETTGGYVDHRVLGADAGALFVVSTIHWAPLGRSRLYYTLLDRTGGVRFQHRVVCNQIITGSAVLAGGGWLLSTQFLGEAQPRQSLFIVDSLGRPYWQVVIAGTDPVQYQVLNTSPPRVLRFANETSLAIHPAVPTHWLDVWESLLLPSTDWVSDPPPAPVGGTNHFWNTPIRVNNL